MRRESAETSPWATIVGIVRDVRSAGILGEVPATMYFPQAQYPYPFLTVIVLSRVTTRLGTLSQVTPREIENLFAADLAKRGLEAPADAIEADFSGFLNTFSRAPQAGAIARDIGRYKFEIKGAGGALLPAAAARPSPDASHGLVHQSATDRMTMVASVALRPGGWHPLATSW